MSKIEKLSLEQCIACHGGPTLAGIKCGNLFRFMVSDWEEFNQDYMKMQASIEKKGVSICVLKVQSNWALLYLYRRKDVCKRLSEPKIHSFMANYGYGTDVDKAIALLGEKVRATDAFPHEIGIFLGYPLEDVQGFICNNGRKCSVCGLWKSYGEPQAAKAQFQKIYHCMEVYRRAILKGCTLEQLTVAS